MDENPLRLNELRLLLLLLLVVIQARRLMRQLFDGVAFMHERNIVHRDLKLENILCIDDERIVISDFGFAKELENGERLRGMLGGHFTRNVQSFERKRATSSSYAFISDL